MVCHPSTHRGAMGSSKEMSNNRPSAPLFVRGTESLLASSASFLTAGWGMGAAGSAAPSSSRGGCLTLRPCSSGGSSHGRSPPGTSPTGSSCTAPALVPFSGSVLQEQAAPAWAPLFTGPARTLLQHRLPVGSQPPSGIPLLQRGLLHGLQEDLCFPVPPPPKPCHTKPIQRGNWGCKEGIIHRKVEG